MCIVTAWLVLVDLPDLVSAWDNPACIMFVRTYLCFACRCYHTSYSFALVSMQKIRFMLIEALVP